MSTNDEKVTAIIIPADRSWMLWGLIAILVASIIVPVIWQRFFGHDGVAEMSQLERQKVFQPAFAEFVAYCQPLKPERQEHCQSQAQFLLKFPECTQSCREAAHAAFLQTPRPR